MQQDPNQVPNAYWAGLMHALGPGFAERADRCDANDAFVAENFAELKERGVLAAGVPAELGGGGASYPELCEMLRILGRYCGSTALTLSMHTHPLATIVWRWRRDPVPFERILRRVADERLQLVTTGASDWLDGSGVAVRVEDGWRPSHDHGRGCGIRAGARCAAFRHSACHCRCDGPGQLAYPGDARHRIA
jgi:alkylation response protein AidB-like acyl-CoA dehydrogenase